MKQKDRQLLLVDLCQRLPFGIKGRVNDRIVTLEGVNITDSVVEHDKYFSSDIDKFVPYLFPMSSMTEEQRKELMNICGERIGFNSGTFIDFSGYGEVLIESVNDVIDWLNANHFDHRGLIEKSLALDATGLNIYKKEEHP